MQTMKQLEEKAQNDRDLQMAIVSAAENAYDLGIDEYDPGFEAEVVRQVEGWEWNGREW